MLRWALQAWSCPTSGLHGWGGDGGVMETWEKKRPSSIHWAGSDGAPGLWVIQQHPKVEAAVVP